jgi:DsbC/DsbD-like thiol-disulfide interchange protein
MAIMAIMNRRHALLNVAALAAMIVPANSGVPQPYKAALISGGKVGGLWQAGVLIELQRDWKTYWRIPGDAGIPPQFDWTGSVNSEAIEVTYPVPARFQDAGGEAIGYHDKVLFPLSIRPKDPAQEVQLKLNMFFAVCKGICIPAKAQLDLVLETASSNQLLAAWQQRVPVTGGTIVANARLTMRKDKPNLVLKLSMPVKDIFVETDTQVYFGPPRFDISPSEAWLPIWNAKGMPSLQGVPLKLTLSNGNTGIEQNITVN